MQTAMKKMKKMGGLKGMMAMLGKGGMSGLGNALGGQDLAVQHAGKAAPGAAEHARPAGRRGRDAGIARTTGVQVQEIAIVAPAEAGADAPSTSGTDC
ncbi:hypothetical protein AB5I41_16145 [Sphingomonas sp. MMS24-JH45]